METSLLSDPDVKWYTYRIEALSHESVWGSGCIDPRMLYSASVVGGWSAARSGHFTVCERSLGAQWIGGWVSFPLPEFELRPLCRPACSESPYRLRRPACLLA
jgi:hypothetical protein